MNIWNRFETKNTSRSRDRKSNASFGDVSFDARNDITKYNKVQQNLTT